MTKYYFKFVLFFFSITFSLSLLGAQKCDIDFLKYNLLSSKDCVNCQNIPANPSDKVESTINPLVNFVTNEKEQEQLIRKFKVFEHFLGSKENAQKCSNFMSIKNQYSDEFQKNLIECEKGSDLLNRNKKLCEWVLTAFNSAINESFYDHWRIIGTDGKVTFKPGKFKEDIESSIRSHYSWCKKVKANYKGKIFLDCQDVESWVNEFDMVQKISDSFKKRRQEEESKINIQEDRAKTFKEGCKYFEKNAATTFTRDLYLKCMSQ